MNALEKYTTKAKLIEKLAVAAPLLLGGGAGYLKGKKSGKTDEGVIRGAMGATGGSLLGAMLGQRLIDPVMKASGKADVRRYKKKQRKAKEKLRADIKSYKSKSFKERLRGPWPKKDRVPMPNPHKMFTKAQNRAMLAAILATSLGGTVGYQALTGGVDKKDKK